MNAQERYQEWLTKLPDGSDMKKELLAIEGNEAEITDRFYQEIVFGTAGLRGICGAGTNRMNELTVGRATQGLAAYIIRSGEDRSHGVAIAYDCRHHSREFSELAAQILAGNGIKTYLFPSLRPTPELSYAVRKLGCAAGINMTASHNPKEYNGYKVYWKDGAQISGGVSDGILAEIEKLSLFDPFPRLSAAEAEQQGLLCMLGEDMDRSYLDYVESMAQRGADELDLTVPIVYTPLNGAGSIPLTRVMAERGFTNFAVVPEQKDPDPDFTTVPFPNPENPKAFALAEKLGKEKGAEVLIATDPDSDRMAVMIADGNGGYTALNGNQTGAMLIAYMAEAQTEKGTLPAKAAMIKSVVTGEFGRAICEDHGIAVFETLTGFKNICGKIPEIQKEGYTYFFGYEESIGCAPGEQVRDKDGICAGMLISEMAAYYRKRGMSMGQALDALYRKYGYFADGAASIVLTGKAGQERIGRMMIRLRALKDERMIGGTGIDHVIDYLHGYADIPPQNCLRFYMTDGSWFAARPSGTEPKIKFYYYSVDQDKDVSAERVKKLQSAVEQIVNAVE